MQIVVGGGPAKGTYTIVPAHVTCVSTVQGIAASYKFFAVPNKNRPGVTMRVRNAKTVSQAQIEVDNSTDRAESSGSVEVTFGNTGEHPLHYLAFAPQNGSLVLRKAGSGSAFAFKGRSRDGVALDGTATCTDTMKL